MSLKNFGQIQSIANAEHRIVDCRNLCLKGMISEVYDHLIEIAAFYENAKLKDRAKAIDRTIDKILNSSEDYDDVLEILNNLALGPNEMGSSIFA